MIVKTPNKTFLKITRYFCTSALLFARLLALLTRSLTRLLTRSLQSSWDGGISITFTCDCCYTSWGKKRPKKILAVLSTVCLHLLLKSCYCRHGQFATKKMKKTRLSIELSASMRSTQGKKEGKEEEEENQRI